MVKTSLASDIAVLSPPRVNELIPITVPPFCASSLLSFSKSPSSPTQGLQVVNQKFITVTLLDEKMSSLLTSFPSRSLPLKLGNLVSLLLLLTIPALSASTLSPSLGLLPQPGYFCSKIVSLPSISLI